VFNNILTYCSVYDSSRKRWRLTSNYLRLNLNFCIKQNLSTIKKNSDEGKYKLVQHSQYIIKNIQYGTTLYFKRVWYKGEIMRFEIKYTKMQKTNERGIYNLQGLTSYGLHNFKDELLNEFNNILFYDNYTVKIPV
jgi:hypothetical protein